MYQFFTEVEVNSKQLWAEDKQNNMIIDSGKEINDMLDTELVYFAKRVLFL